MTVEHGFTSFVVFADMRTGSNFLESNLNALDGVTCHGEAFNPHFVGYPNRDDLLGMTREERDSNPKQLLRRIRNRTEGLGGFRYFHDHDPRVLDSVLDDRGCAKIVLTRNPVESYVSLKIAQATDQWKLTNVSNRRNVKARFDSVEFEDFVARTQEFQLQLQNALQKSGQTAFYISYEDLHDVEVLNGLAAWLGVESRLDGLRKNLKRQNPEPLSEKVENYADLQAALSTFDWANLSRTPNFEPRRGPVVPSYVAAAKSNLLYMPIPGGPDKTVLRWLSDLDEVAASDLLTGFNQKLLREWMLTHPGHRSFTVIRHPLERAHHVFCTQILPLGPQGLPKARRILMRQHQIELPNSAPDANYDLAAHKAAFSGFLEFLKANLAGQSVLKVLPSFATQTQCLQGLSGFLCPDRVIRETDLDNQLVQLSSEVGSGHADVSTDNPEGPFKLIDIYDPKIEELSRQAYHRDYIHFGYSDWSPV